VICTLAAQAMIETGGPDRKQLKGATGEQQVVMVRKWWEEDGIKNDWSKD
jgi:hypothetical protein